MELLEGVKLIHVVLYMGAQERVDHVSLLDNIVPRPCEHLGEPGIDFILRLALDQSVQFTELL